MSDLDHFIDRCECGRIMNQCRCIGRKTERIVSPCHHRPQTKTLKSAASADTAAAEANGFVQRTRGRA